VQDADEDDLYEAMDWLLSRKQRIERTRSAPFPRVARFCMTSPAATTRGALPLLLWSRRTGRRLPIIVYGC